MSSAITLQGWVKQQRLLKSSGDVTYLFVGMGCVVCRVTSFLGEGLVGWVLWDLGVLGIFSLVILNQKQADSGEVRHV